MAMKSDTKNLLIGGAVGALATILGYGLFGKSKEVFAGGLRPQRREDHDRGEYKRRHHKERHDDE